MTSLLVRAIISLAVIFTASELGRRFPRVGGFVLSLPRATGGPSRTAPGAFHLVFRGVRVGGPGDPFADLENRQRRKSFVGSNPTPSVLVVASSRRGSFLSAIQGSVLSGSESARAFAAPDCFAVSIPLGRCRCQR